MKDTADIQKTPKDLESCLIRMVKSGLPGRFKFWIYQIMMTKSFWPFMLYKISMATVVSMESKTSSYPRTCLGLASAALYGSTNALQLSFKGLTEEFKVTRTRETLCLQGDSSDSKEKHGIEVRTGRKWKASRELQTAEERLKHKSLVGTDSIAKGRTGLGYHHNPSRQSY